MSKGKKAALAIVLVIGGMQLIRPRKTNPPVDPARELKTHTQLPADVARVLNRSCGDCHSNQTRWPWYSDVAPVSWVVIDDVNEGRRHVNLSDWAKYDADHAERKLGQICDEVKDGGMPLVSYTWVHKGTKLSQAERDAVCQWTKAERQRIAAAAKPMAANPESTAAK